MSRQSASVVASFSAKTLNYNREILKAVKANQELIVSMINVDKVAKESGKSIGNLGDVMKSSTFRITALVASAKKLVDVLLKLSDAGSRAEEIQQKFDIVFRHNKIEVQAWANELADATNRSSTNIEAFAAHLQNTFVPLGFMREEATDLSKALVELAQDLSSFNDVPTERVINDIRAALLGNVRAVRKYGVSANETAIFQEALIQGWIKEKDEITAVIKARAINNIILRSTGDAQGDLVRTMHQTANVRRAYNEQMERAKEITGDYVNLALTPLRQELVKLMKAWNEAREAKQAFDGLFGEEKIALQIEETERLITNQILLLGLLHKGVSTNFQNIEVEKTQARNRLGDLIAHLKGLQKIQEEQLESEEQTKKTLDLEDKEKALKVHLFNVEQANIKKLRKLEQLRVSEMIAETIRLRDIKRDAMDLEESEMFAFAIQGRELREAEMIAEEEFWLSIPQLAASAISQISALYSALANTRLAEFEWENEQEQKIRDDSYEAEKDRVEAEFVDKQDRDEALKKLSKDTADAEAKIAEDLELERRKMAYKTALTVWNLQLLQVSAQAAQAQIAVWTGLEPIAIKIASSIIAGGIGTLSQLAVAASKPVKNFQTGTRGFTVPEGYQNDSYNVGLSSGERLTVDTPTQQIEDNFGTPMNIYIMWNSTAVGSVFTKSIKNRDTIIHMEDII